MAKVFRARKVECEVVRNARIVDFRQAVKKDTGEVFDVAVFEDEQYGRQDIVLPNGWEPRGYDLNDQDAYHCGWIPGDVQGKSLFRCAPAAWGEPKWMPADRIKH